MKVSELDPSTLLIVSPCVENTFRILVPSPLETQSPYQVALQNVPYQNPFIITTAGEMGSGYIPDFCNPDGYGLGFDRFNFEMARDCAERGNVDRSEHLNVALHYADRILNSEGLGEM